MSIIDGRAVAKKIRDDVKSKIAGLGFQPGLAVILIGDNWESKLYIEQKEIACKEVGIQFFLHEFISNVNINEVISLIQKLNADRKVQGILVQLPISAAFDLIKIQETIDPWKDVDGFNPINRGLLYSMAKKASLDIMIPCTPAGVMRLLQEYDVDVNGNNVVVIGRSNIVGKPLSYLLLQKGATVTICHSQTKDLEFHTQNADILVCAAGHPALVTAEMVKKGVVVIDVALNRITDQSKKGYHIVGDTDFEKVKSKASLITPVPGGVGPMTVAMLLQNILKASLIK